MLVRYVLNGAMMSDRPSFGADRVIIQSTLHDI